MSIAIEITCPHCHSRNIKRNGKKRNCKQNYFCRDCRRQFLAPSDYGQHGRNAQTLKAVARSLVRGMGIRDARAVFGVSFAVIYRIIGGFRYDHKPRKSRYGTLEIDEFWTYVGRKKRKIWLIYAYDREGGEIVAHVWGRRDLRTARKLRRRLILLGVECDAIATDNWESFAAAFESDNHLKGKCHTKGIEGNNCLLRHRNRRFFRKTCCFSKSLRCHWKVFSAVLFYLNNGSFLLPAYLS